MTKKYLIALAQAIREHNRKSGTHSFSAWNKPPFDEGHLSTLADFCASQNPNFNRSRWMDYIRSASIPLPSPK